MTTSEKYQKAYNAWKAYINNDKISIFSSDAPYIENKHFQAIINLGKDAIPHIMDTLCSDDEDAHFLIHALEKITEYKFSDKEINAAECLFGTPLGNQDYVYMWLGWWEKQKKNRYE